MPKDSILVTPRSLSRDGHPILKRLEHAGYEVVFPAPGRQPKEDDLLSVIDNAVGYLAGVEPITANVIGSAPRLKVISRNGVGIDNVDLAAAEKAGIKVTKAVGANARGVAELAFGCILAGARSIPAGDAALKSRNWSREKGFELEGKTLGLVGAGRIGQLVARFALAFGMKVVAYDPYPNKESMPDGDFSYVDFDTVIQTSDVISLHCPPQEDGFIIDRSTITAMKSGIILVNTARAGLIDEEAVIEALDSGHIRALTNDAYPVEPPDDWTLTIHPRVIATAHIGGFTGESIDRATEAAVENLLAVLEA